MCDKDDAMKKSTKTQKQKTYTEETLFDAVDALVSSRGFSNDFLASIRKKEFSEWTPRMRYAAHVCVTHRYAEELKALGFDPEKLVKPTVKETVPDRVVDFADKVFVVQFPYNWPVLQALKDNVERKDMKFDKEKKLWLIPAKFAKQVANFVDAVSEMLGVEFKVTTSAKKHLHA